MPAIRLVFIPVRSKPPHAFIRCLNAEFLLLYEAHIRSKDHADSHDITADP